MYGAGDAECETFDWGKWSPCSSRCGMGKRMRTRVYRIPFVDNRSCNNVNLIERVFCEGVDCDAGQVGMTPAVVLIFRTPTMTDDVIMNTPYLIIRVAAISPFH